MSTPGVIVRSPAASVNTSNACQIVTFPARRKLDWRYPAQVYVAAYDTLAVVRTVAYDVLFA